jgi:hypothetical protein
VCVCVVVGGGGGGGIAHSPKFRAVQYAGIDFVVVVICRSYFVLFKFNAVATILPVVLTYFPHLLCNKISSLTLFSGHVTRDGGCCCCCSGSSSWGVPCCIRLSKCRKVQLGLSDMRVLVVVVHPSPKSK